MQQLNGQLYSISLSAPLVHDVAEEIIVRFQLFVQSLMRREDGSHNHTHSPEFEVWISNVPAGEVSPVDASSAPTPGSWHSFPEALLARNEEI